MKKTLLVAGLLVAGVVSAFPFRTSCGKVVQVSQTIANNMSMDQLANYLGDVNGEQCPGSGPVVVHVYYH
ncbi:hypothetical protein EGI15_07440 [Chryseobacterium cucumeris]|uniref:DUF1161 domain-containing protein n=1 Tax=Chryseobacterium cucumeris TaxID=1813611 RepID=A0ABX9XBF6_9FLAO|nr:hypothetical protein [Chryseobacterium cucumeris]ROH94316.1 hypothetical protein EGI15_07440 [Chryseobacterium cucumeris]